LKISEETVRITDTNGKITVDILRGNKNVASLSGTKVQSAQIQVLIRSTSRTDDFSCHGVYIDPWPTGIRQNQVIVGTIIRNNADTLNGYAMGSVASFWLTRTGTDAFFADGKGMMGYPNM